MSSQIGGIFFEAQDAQKATTDFTHHVSQNP